MSMCAPLLPPSCASYIDAFTRTSSRVSGGGVGSDSPTARYTDAVLCTGSELRLDAPLTPVLFTIRAEATWLVLLPLKRLLPSTPLSMKLLLVSRCPLAQIGAFPKPEFAPAPPDNSALTPGVRIATPVKLPVDDGIAFSWLVSSTYPFVVSTELSSGVTFTVTVCPTSPSWSV